MTATKNDNKTKARSAEATAFIDAQTNEQHRHDGVALLSLLEEITGEKPQMWGASMVGFGSYHYKYDSGREGDMFITGFAPRKQNLTIYIMSGFEQHAELMKKLGKYKLGKSCLYIKKLEDIDLGVLRKLIKESVKYMKNKYK